jgi:hypothetical protein
LNDKLRQILNTDCNSALEIAKAITKATGYRIPPGSVPVYGEGYAKKLMGEIREPRKAWKKLLRG